MTEFKMEHFNVVGYTHPERSRSLALLRPKAPREYAGELVSSLRSGTPVDQVESLSYEWNEAQAVDVPVSMDIPTSIGGIRYRSGVYNEPDLFVNVILSQGSGRIKLDRHTQEGINWYSDKPFWNR